MTGHVASLIYLSIHFHAICLKLDSRCCHVFDMARWIRWIPKYVLNSEVGSNFPPILVERVKLKSKIQDANWMGNFVTKIREIKNMVWILPRSSNIWGEYKCSHTSESSDVWTILWCMDSIPIYVTSFSNILYCINCE